MNWTGGDLRRFRGERSRERASLMRFIRKNEMEKHRREFRLKKHHERRHLSDSYESDASTQPVYHQPRQQTDEEPDESEVIEQSLWTEVVEPKQEPEEEEVQEVEEADEEEDEEVTDPDEYKFEYVTQDCLEGLTKEELKMRNKYLSGIPTVVNPNFTSDFGSPEEESIHEMKD